MPIYVDTLPQNVAPCKTFSLRDLIQVLPEIIPYSCNLWMTGKVVRYGLGAGNITFVGDHSAEQHQLISLHLNQVLNSKVENVLLSRFWRTNQITGLRVYQDGRLIIDKNTLQYKEIPNPIIDNPYITIDEVIKKLPQNIPWNHTIYLSGGILKNGWSFKDVDMIIFNPAAAKDISPIIHYFKEILNWHVDIGQSIMTDREPVYLFKLYENGSKTV